jgi:hypothetical protein
VVIAASNYGAAPASNMLGLCAHLFYGILKSRLDVKSGEEVCGFKNPAYKGTYIRENEFSVELIDSALNKNQKPESVAL